MHDKSQKTDTIIIRTFGIHKMNKKMLILAQIY